MAAWLICYHPDKGFFQLSIKISNPILHGGATKCPDHFRFAIFLVDNMTWNFFTFPKCVLTLPGRGGAYLAHPLTFLFIAFKRMYILVRNFLTFLIY